jgi:hypothetical protein
MITAMRKGELLCINIEDKPFDFEKYSDPDEFPVKWVFDHKNLKDIDDICRTSERFDS